MVFGKECRLRMAGLFWRGGEGRAEKKLAHRNVASKI